jgi:UPF0755 protein
MENELDPNKFHVFDDRKKKLLVVIVLFFCAVILPILSLFYYKFAVRRPSQTFKEITFEIRKGDSVSEISSKLSDLEAINSEFLFNLYIFMNKKDSNIQAGVYTISAGTSIVDLVAQFQHGTNDIKITFLEGWRIEEFARLACNSLSHIDYQQFVDIAKQHEGYLFPDTYFFADEIQEEELINTLLETFKQKTQDILTNEALTAVGLTKDQAIIFASIVEREVRTLEDRRIVAGILINRWESGMKLDADATTQYAVAVNRVNIDWWPNDLTFAELSFESPYNTRAVVGLPPTPISSISLSALKAVLEYKQTDYLYYLTDEDGVTHYAETLDGHNANISKYLYK